MGDRSEKAGERGQFLPDSRRIVGLCNENRGEIGPLSRLRSRFIHNPIASQPGVAGTKKIFTAEDAEERRDFKLLSFSCFPLRSLRSLR